MLKPMNLKITKDTTQDKWLISSELQRESGRPYVIVCETEEMAKELVRKIEEDYYKYPLLYAKVLPEGVDHDFPETGSRYAMERLKNKTL